MKIEEIQQVFEDCKNELKPTTFASLLGIEIEKAEEILKQGEVFSVFFEPIKNKYSLISPLPKENVKEFQEFLDKFFSDVGAVGKIKIYSDIPITPESEIKIQKQVYDGIETKNFSPLEINKVFKIYQGKIGEGHKNIFIIIESQENLFGGLNDLRLKKINYLDLKRLAQEKEILPEPSLFLTKKQEDKLKKIYGELNLEILIQKDEILVFKKIQATSADNLIEAIKTLSFEKILNDFLEENSTLDKNLKYVWRKNNLTFGNKCNPEFSKYNDHEILETNTKTGKTTQYEKASPELKFDSGTASGLVGFSTADITNEGSINSQFKKVILDDFAQANYQKEILDNMPTLLENGRMLITKGKQKNLTKCSSAFSLTTNPNPKATEKELMLEFSKILRRLTETPQRIGSRFALTLFGNDFKPVQSKEKIEFSKKDINVNNLIAKQIFFGISNFAGELLENEEIIVWLEKENSEYKKLITEILKNGTLFGDLKDYWKSTIGGYRHQRGFSLKQGIIDYFINNKKNLIGLLKGEMEPLQVKEILNFAEENLNQLNDLNLMSLRNLSQVSQSEKDYLKSRFEGLKQEYLKAILKAVFKMLREKPDKRGTLITISEIGDFLESKSYYSAPSKILEKLPQNLDRINREISIFGIEVLEREDIKMIQIYKNALEMAFSLTKSWEDGENGEDGERNSKSVPENSREFPKEEKENKEISKGNKDSVPEIPHIPKKIEGVGNKIPIIKVPSTKDSKKEKGSKIMANQKTQTQSHSKLKK